MKSDSKEKILIVDDSGMAREFYSCIVKSSGYEVAVAENGIIALEKINSGCL